MDEEGESDCLEKLENEGQDLISCSRSTNMVFSHVIATFALEMMECINGDKEEFLKGQMSENLNYLHNAETGAHCVYGSLDDIVEYRNKLESLMDLLDESNENITDGDQADKNETQIHVYVETANNDNRHISEIGIREDICAIDYGNDTTNKVYRDIAVSCDLYKEEIKKNSQDGCDDKKERGNNADDQHKETHCDTSGDILQKSANEIIQTQSTVVTKSKRGRLIKRPLKLQEEELDDTNIDDSQQDSTQLFLQDEEMAVSKPAEKKKRRLLKSKKRGNVIRPKDRGKISVEEVRRLVQAEKEKEERDKEKAGEGSASVEKRIELDMLNAGVLQTMFLNSWNECQEQGSQKEGDKSSQFDLIKDVDQRKQMKKYYEDRMPFKYFCFKCSFKTKRESHYQAHMNLHERKPNMALFTCEHCDFVSIRQSVLKRHQLTHAENLISCPMDCSFKTQSNKSLKTHTKKTHMNSVYIDSDSLHSCELCPFQTTSRLKLMTHKALHGQHLTGTSKTGQQLSGTLKPGQTELIYKCDQCNYKTSKRVHLVRHENNVHSNKRPFLCDLCGAAFKRTDALAAHKTTHLDRSKRKLPYVCPHCKKAFKSWAHLKEHSSVHTTVRSFQCHICGQMFKTRSVQRRHQQSIHFNPRSHKCSHCNKEFNTKYAFKRHLRIHDNDPVGQTPTQVQPQVVTEVKETVTAEETIDENVSAIQTITIAPENIGEFTQQLQNVSDQLQSSTDIGEIYIQGLDGIESGTINIVSMSGQELRQIFIPSDTDPNTMLASSDQVKQILATSKSDDSQTTDEKGIMKQVYVTSGADNIDVSEFKQLYVQQSTNSDESTRPILLTVNANSDTGFQSAEAISVDLVEDGTQVLEGAQSLEGNQTLIVQDIGVAGIQGVEEGVGDKSGAKSQTFELKFEGGQTLLTLGSTAVQNL